jgi:hypothetical protein
MQAHLGTAHLEGLDGPLVAGSSCSYKLIYTAGYFGVDDSGSLKISERFATDSSPPQFSDPGKQNYVEVKASNGAGLYYYYDVKNNIRPWGKTLYIKLFKGNLRQGDQLIVTYSNKHIQTFVEHRHTMKVFVDAYATYDYAEIRESPWYQVIAGEPETMHAYVPTIKSPGDKFSLHLRTDDKWGNPTQQSPGTFYLHSDHKIENLPDRVTFTGDSPVVTVRDLRCHQEGDIFISVLNTQREFVALTNPLRITSDRRTLFSWGDLHGQSEETIGSNTIKDYFQFARDYAFLDVCSHQGNDFQITKDFWETVQQTTRDFYNPGTFVTFPGYEWSGNTSLGGDHNIYYKNEGETIHRSSHALIPDLSDESSDRYTINELFKTLSSKDCFVYAHVGGRFADLTYPVEKEVPFAVEIHSDWGTFEWLLFDAFEQGKRVGIVANSDGHKGRPGSSTPGRAQFGSHGGLTCFLSERLDREGIFDALLKRHHYATTGARMYLDVQSSSPDFTRAIMGDEVETRRNETTLRIETSTHAPIERIDVFNGQTIIDTKRPFSITDEDRRIMIMWEGAEYRGRGRQTVWDGSAHLNNNQFENAYPINFWNPERPLSSEKSTTVSWKSITTGGVAGIVTTLRHSQQGEMAIHTPLVSETISISDIDAEGIFYDAGGLGRMLHVHRLPTINSAYRMEFEIDVALTTNRDNPVFVRVRTEDGHMAWSSPIYFHH